MLVVWNTAMYHALKLEPFSDNHTCQSKILQLHSEKPWALSYFEYTKVQKQKNATARGYRFSTQHIIGLLSFSSTTPQMSSAFLHKKKNFTAVQACFNIAAPILCSFHSHSQMQNNFKNLKPTKYYTPRIFQRNSSSLSVPTVPVSQAICVSSYGRTIVPPNFCFRRVTMEFFIVVAGSVMSIITPWLFIRACLLMHLRDSKQYLFTPVVACTGTRHLPAIKCWCSRDAVVVNRIL